MANMPIPGTEDFKTQPSKYSYFTPYGYQSGSCGYCKDAESSQRTPSSRGSYYVQSPRLTASHYQSLLDRGWRRSGTLLYLPDPSRSCCPHYTIRLPAEQFKPTKDQRQALNRWNRHILGPNYAHEAAKRKPKSREEKRREQSGAFDHVKAVHEPKKERLVEGVEPAMKYEVRLENDDFTEEKYNLFEQYQRKVHHESPSQISKSGFKRFLCGSPIVRGSNIVTLQVLNGQLINPDATIIKGETGLVTQTFEQKLGSYHQTHRLDGKLVAMSVLDLLPHGVSAVYFIYDVKLSAFSLGKVSALREAALALEGVYGYYYMGYYIHSCTKMRYKNDYRPQYFLDWETLDWDRLDGDALSKLDEKKYVSMSRERRLDAGEAEDSVRWPKPKEAEAAGKTLWELEMPGIVPLVELWTQMSPFSVLASTKMPESSGWLRRPKSLVVPMTFLGGWEQAASEEDVLSDPTSLVASVSELCAAVGVEVAREMVVDFGGGVVDVA